jgi:16S rRNA C967 or C1407 C5-methylase (RsmB/RsmF family)/NOL1/NOP2/fmu family ribosome biogenesis protein
MMLPPALVTSLQHLPGFEAAPFCEVHEAGGQVSSIRLNTEKWQTVASGADITPLLKDSGLPFDQPIPWCQSGHYLRHRPSYTNDPLLHAGAYYVQEASSMFIAEAIRQTCGDAPLRVLDLCAAPGGKSTLLQSCLPKDSLLVSNEVIKTRVNILVENIAKWGALNTVVTNNDPKQFARLGAFFDLILVDAPCSGSGLFRRDPDAIAEWSEDAVTLCQQRQQRILADVLPALKPNGILLYATCSYSPAEDEDIADWLSTDLGLDNIRFTLPPDSGIVESAGRHSYGYRFFPHLVRGEGFFLAGFRNTATTTAMPQPGKPVKTTPIAAAIQDRLRIYWQPGTALQFLPRQDEILAIAPAVQEVLPTLQGSLYLRKAGVNMGKLIGGTLVPDHELALATAAATALPHIALDTTAAMQYLRRNTFTLPPAEKGWNRVTYKGFALGWVKVMANRYNNYYPVHWRVLMQE